MKCNPTFLLLFFSFFGFYQMQAQDFGIQMGSDLPPQACDEYNVRFYNRPKEDGFGIKREADLLYLEVTSKDWLLQLLKTPLDGVAIDVVSKDQYACGADLPNQQIRGKLLKPVYKPQLLQRLKSKGSQRWRTLVGKVPVELKDKSLEFNILFLSRKNLCQYYNVYNLKSYPWELLDMGVFLDEIVSRNTANAPKKGSKRLSKTINFVVPFEKNKSEYLPADVKPIYDSLQLTDYDIAKIKINAYASVEGSKAINEKLQRDRGNSMIKALQSFAGEKPATELQTSENWAEFYESIRGTKFEDLAQLTKQQIKEKLAGQTGQLLEPTLAQQRKAVISITLNKIERFKDQTNMELVQSFNTQLKKGDLENAMIIQRAILDRALTSSNTDLIDKMEVPRQAKYADLKNNKAVFGYYKDQRQALIARGELKEILGVAPTNKKVNYNIAAINIYLLRYGYGDVEEIETKQEVRALKKLGVSNDLINRMLLNIEIIKAEKAMAARDYDEKDKAVKNIKTFYKGFPLTSQDYLSLAQFLNYYDNLSSSQALLYPLVSQVQADEDLVFYYINQTIAYNTNVAKNDYRVILNNANGQNPKRFCQLFDASTEGGVTFQLADNLYLRTIYCENCSQE
ncbi:hypothetical protein [Nonlabens xiamenensis]|uniref:hypothetical protein n=1 Tax=Nonlabens xiamenensis TaxID=2341043 RepID=UPI000F60799B|nr:hypothetical protein [Nonlabens xiamenensis]